MTGRRSLSPRMRSGLTLLELLVAIAVLGVLEILLLTAQAPAPAPVPSPPLSIAQPPPAPLEPSPYQGELSLQTTLDRLGFTVNVPQHYEGRRVSTWAAGRVSTRSDAMLSGWFEARGPLRFAAVSRQADLRDMTTFSAETPGGDRIDLLPRRSGENGAADASASGSATRDLRGTYRFLIDFAPNGYSKGPFYSTPSDNPEGSAQLLVLPARRGGTWVDEGENTGHWEGGTVDNACLLCWEDVVHDDNDFQDLVVYAQGVQPAQR